MENSKENMSGLKGLIPYSCQCSFVTNVGCKVGLQSLLALHLAPDTLLFFFFGYENLPYIKVKD